MMSAARTSVAQVLLVAHPSRRGQLGPWLEVEGEPVGYTLECRAPADVYAAAKWDGATWDVIVVDGESFPDERERLALLRRLDERPRVTSIVFVCSRLPLERELEHASIFCDDWILPGWAHPERVRRRLQVIALAPWRRQMALRRRAEQLGDERLRVLRSCDAGGVGRDSGVRRAGHARGFVLLEQAYRSGATPRMVADAFHEGRRAAVASVAEGADGVFASLREELVRMRVTLPEEAAEDIESAARARADRDGMTSVIVAARVQGAEGALDGAQGQLARIISGELDAIERREAGSR